MMMKLPDGMTEEQLKRGTELAMATLATLEKVIRVAFGDEFYFALVISRRDAAQSLAVMSAVDNQDELLALLERAVSRVKADDMINVEQLGKPLQ